MCCNKKFDLANPSIWEVNNSYTLNELVSITQTFGYPVSRTNISYVEKRVHFASADGMAFYLKPNEIAVCRQMLVVCDNVQVSMGYLTLFTKGIKLSIFQTNQWTNCFVFTGIEFNADFMMEYDVYKFDNLPSAVS